MANPGHLPWMVHAAIACARAGILDAYFTPLAATADEMSTIRSIPTAVGRALAKEIQRREVPQDLPASALRRTATLSELLTVAASRARAPHRLQRALADRRDAAFDRGVSSRIAPDAAAVYLTYGAALRSLLAARTNGVRTLLQFATHHHAFAERTLTAELTRVPEYAPTMQFHNPSVARKRLLNAEITHADRVVVLSDFSKATFVDAGVAPEKIVVATPGVDSQRFKPAPGASPRQNFRVLFVGPLTQRKGLSYAVDGFEAAAIPGSELLLVGTPWRGCSPWAGRRRVQHLPWVTSAELPPIYASGTVLVLPSLEDGFGRVVLEAMASGIPAIVTPAVGAADVITDGVDGYVVPVRDPSAIAERLTGLFSDPNAASEMGRAARRTAEKYTWSRYGAQILSEAAPATSPADRS